jgi:hypothetical protein
LYKYGFLQNEIRKIDFEKLLKTQRKSNEWCTTKKSGSG